MICSVAHASPQDLFGYGGRTPALAMTGTSYAEGAEAVFANPAGLAASRRNALMLGVQGSGYNLQINGERSPIVPARGIIIAFQLPVPFEDVLEDRLVIGGAFYTPAEVLLRGRVDFPEVPQWTVLDRGQVLALMIGVGFDFHDIVDGLQVGVGFAALANVFGELAVRLDETNAFSSVVETQLLTAFSPFVGARYAQDEWGIGLSYRHESRAEFALNIRTEDLPIELPLLTVGGIAQYDPPTVLLEGYWRPIPELMLIANVTTRVWSVFPGQQIPSTVGSLNAPDPAFSVRPSPRIAAEGTWSDDNFILSVRGGYAFEWTPAPSAREAPRRLGDGTPVSSERVAYRLLDNSRHVLTAGVGWTILLGAGGERLVLDFYGQAHILQERTHRVPLRAGEPSMVTDGYILTAGWTGRVEF